MSWLGSLWNAAKVGVNLLNGIINPQGGAAADFQTALLLNPAAAIKVAETGETWRIISAFVADTANPARRGKVMHLFEGGAIEEGDLLFAITQEPGGGSSIQVINNNPNTDYYVNFGITSALAGLQNQNVPVGRKGGDYPNMVNVSGQFSDFSLGNLVVTPVQQTAPSTQALPTIPLSPSPSSRSPFFSRKKKSAENLQDLDLPLSTVLGNIGFSAIIAGAFFTLYSSSAGNVSVTWKNNGLAVSSYVVTNDTDYAISVSASVNWSNPAIASTVNVKVPPGGTAEGFLPDNESPISTASVCAWHENSTTKERKKILQGAFDAAKADGLTGQTVKFAKTAKPSKPANGAGADDSLTPKEKQLLAALKAIGGDEVLLKLQGSSSNGTKQAGKKSLNTALAQITFEDD
jgi:hypothetical protein